MLTSRLKSSTWPTQGRLDGQRNDSQHYGGRTGANFTTPISFAPQTSSSAAAATILAFSVGSERLISQYYLKCRAHYPWPNTFAYPLCSPLIT